MFLANLILVLFANNFAYGKTEDELLAVCLLYRHGDRAPIAFYPNDPYKDSPIWHASPGELTNLGKLQHYNLGKWIRNRYNGFISPLYNKSEIYICSSDANRCLMSAGANLAGLYPPQGEDVWKNDLLWQPIPIHTSPYEYDDICRADVSCPKYSQLRDEVKMSPYFKQLDDDNAEFYKYLSEKTGSNITNFNEAGMLYDTLSIEIYYNLTVPDWALDALPKLSKLQDIVGSLFTYTPELARLFIGRFFQELLVQFDDFSGENSNGLENQKFRVFSAHGEHAASILNVLQIQAYGVPYAALIIFELRRSKEGKLYVQFALKKEDDVANLLEMQGCGMNCDFQKFVKIIEPVALTKKEFMKECY